MNRKAIFAPAFFAVSFGLSQPLFAAVSKPDPALRKLLPVHVVLMSVSASLLVAGAVVARIGKGNITHWFQRHKALEWSGGVLGLAGIIVAVIMVQAAGRVHFRVPHSIFATVSFMFLVVSIITAYGFLKGKHYKKRLRVVHRWLGRLTVLAWVLTILLGLLTLLTGDI